MSLYLRFFPDKAPGMITYLFNINRFSLSHPFTQVSLYDTLFRRRLALYHPATFWGAIDEDTKELCFQNPPVVPAVSTPSAVSPASSASSYRCFSCNQLGHFASHCPSSPHQHVPAPVPSPRSAVPPFPVPQRPRARHAFTAPRPSSFSFQHAPDRQALCNTYRDQGACHFPNCRFFHGCTICGGAHPSHSCSGGKPSS